MMTTARRLLALALLTASACGPAAAPPLPAVRDDDPAARDDAPAVDPPARPRFVAVGPHLRRSTSTDGLTWAPAVFDPAPTTNDDTLLRRVTFGGGAFVAVGGDAVGLSMRSVDGVAWETHTDDTGWIGGVAFGAGQFVAVGNNGMHERSPDGLAWTDQAFTFPGAGRAVAFGAGRFVAVGDFGLRAVSVDGVTFAATVDELSDGHDLTAVAFGAMRFVAVGFGGRRLSSPDGAAWDEAPPLPAHEDASFGGVAFGGGVFLAAAPGTLARSADGVAWEVVPDDEGRAPAGSLAYADGRFVGVAWPNGRTSSPDGATWTEAVADDGPDVTDLVGAE